MSYPEYTVKRRKTVYMRVICGVRKAMIQKKRIIMLTLTTGVSTADGLTEDQRMELIVKSWNSLHAALTDRYGNFEHFSEVTNEGNGVMHIAIYGLPFVYWKRIARLWNTIHGSQLISIGKAHGSSEGIAGYLMTQYLANQKATKVYFRSSANWVVPRFMKYWRILKNASRNYAAGVFMVDWQRWYYPVDMDQLIINFKIWVRYLALTGRALPYVPSKYDYNRSLLEYEL